MQIFVEPQHDLPLCDVQVLVCGGPAADEPGKEGLSRHAFELMRRGAGGRPRTEVDALFDSLGAVVELATGHDYVALHATCLGRNLEAVLALAADMLLRPRIDAEEHERLRREELAMLDELRDDDAVLATRFHDRFALPGHPYGRPAVGTAASLSALTPADVEAWIGRRIVKDNLVMGFAGDIAPEQAYALGAKAFAGISDRPSPPPPAFPPLATGSRRRTYVVDKPERSQTQLVIGHGAPSMGHPDFLALQVAGVAFGGSFSSRLMQEVRVKRGWSYGASFGAVKARGGHAFRLRCAPAVEQTPDTLALVLRLWEEATANGLGADEIEHAKAYIEGGFAFDSETAAARLGQKLALVPAGLPPDSLATFIDRLRAVDVPAANRALRTYWHPEGAVIVLTATAEELVPRLRGLAIGDIEVVPYDED